MPASSSAALSRPVASPDEIGEPIRRERRCFRVAAVYGVPAAFLVVLAIAVRPLAAHLALAIAALVMVGLLLRGRRAGRGPDRRLTSVTLAGDSVHLHATVGVLTLGHVARQRALVKALSRVAPQVRVERDIAAFWPT
jgi:hypothetical protein